MKFEVLITCDKTNDSKIDKYCNILNSMLDFAELSGDAPTLSTYARYGFMSLTKEQLKMICNDLITNEILCNICIIKANN